MGVGHFAVAVTLKKMDRRINLGFLVFAAMFADFLLGLLVLTGIEQVHIPANFASLHYLTFTFPFSHGLAASLFWALAAFLLARTLFKWDTLAGLTLSIAVFSHFILDWIVHIPELPLLGPGSPLLGLGLWNNIWMGLGVEMVLVLIALAVYLGAIPSLSLTNRLGVAIILVLFSALTVVGQALSTQAPPPMAAAATWIGETLLVSGIAFWLDRSSALKKSDH